ncbi:hypothetical protein MTO96_049696 [Rhipicephalus appendiculatus]
MTRPLPLLLPVVLVAAAASGARCPQDQDRWDASNKALTASLVFQGRLLSKSVDAAGNLLARFRVQKVLKPMPTATLRRRQEVVVALVKSRPPPTQQHLNRSASPRAPRRDALNNEALAPRRRTLCPVSVPQGFVFNARYLVYANPIAGRAARRLLLPAAANFSAAATPDHYTRRAGRAVKKVVCNGCGECTPSFCSAVPRQLHVHGRKALPRAEDVVSFMLLPMKTSEGIHCAHGCPRAIAFPCPLLVYSSPAS